MKNRMINTRFWSDGWIINLDPLERYLYLYFLTNEHTNICGIYELPLRIIARESGIDDEMIQKMLRKMTEKITFIDGWVYIKNFAKHQLYNESVKIGIEKARKEIPKHILAKIIEIEQSGGSLGTPRGVFELESELESKSELKPKRSKMSEEDFLLLWNTYPRHTGGKKLPKSKFLTLPKKLLIEILSAVETQKKSEQWQKDDGQFIPHLATWLNQERWTDEMKEKPLGLDDLHKLLQNFKTKQQKLGNWNLNVQPNFKDYHLGKLEEMINGIYVFDWEKTELVKKAIADKELHKFLK